MGTDQIKVVSTTLSGNNPSLIADALLSIKDYVDACILIDTGITDNTLELAKEAVGDKLVVVKYTWVGDFAAARNFALEAAQAWGADWAITVDSDERIVFNGFDLKTFLVSCSNEMLLMRYEGGIYVKERVFQLPIKGRYVGPTHEAFSGCLSTGELLEGYFWELGKDQEALDHKFRRDVSILEKYTLDNPSDPRWFYYLGESYRNIGDLDGAINSFHRCWVLNGWDEESAYAAYKEAQCYSDLKDYQSAIEACCRGMARHSGMPELAWFAGWCCYQLGRYDKVIYYASMAVSLNAVDGIGKQIKRTGFRHIPASYEGPFDLLHWAYQQLGDLDKAQAADKRCRELMEIRIKQCQ